MKTLHFEIALELWDGLCKEMGASDEERARALQYDDDGLVRLFETFVILRGLYTHPDNSAAHVIEGRTAIRSFIRERNSEFLDHRSAADLIFSGDPRELEKAASYIRWVAGG